MKLTFCPQQMIKQKANGYICSTSAKSYINLHLPLIQGNNNDCQGADKSCGADGKFICFLQWRILERH
jgi:hypothetical protein